MADGKYDGILVIYKEKGYTSNDVVSILRGILKMKKIGHTGTLDPDAKGVLPVCLGKGTRLVSLLTGMDKTYHAVARLGITTDTEDMTGEVRKRAVIPPGEEPGEEDVKRALYSFIGGYDQVPPMYSAKKINGRKLYELAREGKEVERKPCRVEIYEAEVLSYKFPYIDFRVKCGSGTYIRSLIRDMGEALGTGAAMESLIRERAASFSIEKALKLSEVEEHAASGNIGSFILSPESLFSELPKITVNSFNEKLVRNGNRFKTDPSLPGGDYRVHIEDGGFAAIYTVSDGIAVLKRMFL